LGDVDLADKYWSEVSEIEARNPEQREERQSRLLFARIAEYRGNVNQAESVLRSLIADEKASSSQRWEAEARLAHLYAERGESTEAEKYYSRSLDTVESARSSVQGEELRLSFLSTAVSIYGEYVDFLID